MPQDPDALRRYRNKRHASHTPEPFTSNIAGAQRFVVQKHGARREHYDFRLEWRGVLKSWAVPKGPHPDPTVKRLAVEVEDHPSDYALFEGIIPEGNYGAGPVIVWDTGAWAALEDADLGLERGKLLFELRGYKLRGVWQLVRSHGKNKTGHDWLLIKKPDAYAVTEPAWPEVSVLSGLALEEVRTGSAIQPTLQADLTQQRLPAAPSGGALTPMLATAVEQPFNDPTWFFELKYDGFRMLARRDAAQVTLHYRRGVDATALYPELVTALNQLPITQFTLDAEVVVHDALGIPCFQALQARALLNRSFEINIGSVVTPATLYVFDLLTCCGLDLRSLPLWQRKDYLQRFVPRLGPVCYADHVVGIGVALFKQVQKRGLEGLVAKQQDSTYRGGRSKLWLKIPTQHEDDFVVVGFTAAKGSRVGLGALQVALWQDDAWVYRGGVGTGLTDAMLAASYAKLQAYAVETPPVRQVPGVAGVTWVRPELVITVRYKMLTGEGLLRQAVFLRWRTDKEARECIAQQSVTAPSSLPMPKQPPEPHTEAPVRQVPFTHLEKVFWPDEGYTKGDLIAFYRDIAPFLLPYLKDRPLVLTRFPRRHHRQVLLSKGCAQVGAFVAAHRADVERRHRARYRLFYLRRRGIAVVCRQHGHHSTAHLVKPGVHFRAARLVHS